MNPKSRNDDIVVEEVFDELVIYDLKRDKVHSLNPTAAFVWRHCDGNRTPAELAMLLQQNYKVSQADALLWSTLDRLEKAKLLEEKTPPPKGQRVLTRREMLKTMGLTVALLPVVKSIVAPTAAQAATPSDPCGGCPNGECCCRYKKYGQWKTKCKSNWACKNYYGGTCI